MAVAFDAVGPGATSAQATGATTLSWSHTAGSGVALTVMGDFEDSASTGKTFTSANLDPAGANTNIPTIAARQLAGNPTAESGFIQMFGLANVASGAHTVKLTASAIPSNSLMGGSVSYTGADLTSPFSASQSNTNSAISTTHSITFTGSTPGNMVTAGIGEGDGALSAASPGTNRHLNNFDGATRVGAFAQADIAAGGSVTITWASTSSDWHGIVAVEVMASSGGTASPTAQANDKWFNRYKRGRKLKPETYPSSAPQPPTIFPAPLPVRRVALPAMARRRAQPAPAIATIEDWPQVRRPQPVLSRRARAQFVPVVAAPVVAQPVFMAPRIKVVQLSRIPQRQQTTFLRLQVSGPLPALTARPTRQVAFSPRRYRMAALPPGMPLVPGRPARRFVAHPPRPARRQLSLLPQVPLLRKRVVLPLPRIGKRQAQLAPTIVVVVQPTVQQQTLPRKAAWFGLRIKRTQQMTPTAAAPPVAVIQTGLPAKARWLGFRYKRTQQAAIVGAPPPVPVTPFVRSVRRQQPAVPARRPGRVSPTIAAPPAQRRAVLRSFGVRPQRNTPRPAAVPALPVQAPARRIIGPKRQQAQRGFVQSAPPAKPPPLGQQGSRARLTTFLRRLLRRSLNILGAPPPSNFPGFVFITNRQMEPVTITNVSAAVAINDRTVGAVAISDTAAGVAITNTEAGNVNVSNL